MSTKITKLKEKTKTPSNSKKTKLQQITKIFETKRKEKK
jgi:hypothetical protein